ncbi:MAG: serine/threonine protein kinase [Archangium sp.]|nr:serine/threonine protein kinase [Archangium sp.]
MGAFETISTWFSSDAEPKGAAKGLLERIIVEERDRSVLAVCRLRFLFGTLNALVVFPTTELEGHTALWPSRYGAVLYAVLAGLLLLLVQFKPKTRGFAAFAPAFLDVPLVGTIEYVQAQYTTAHGIGAASSVTMLLTFLLLSTIALSRRVILIVAPITLAFITAILSTGQVPWVVRGNVIVATAGFAVLALVLVAKIRRLVTASRQRDLLGKYVLGERLGAGGMAEVFRAVYCPEGGFERTVAVKRILPSWANVPELVALFRREAELGARLAHPNVVQVLDFGSDGDTYFLAMEFVDGISLGRLLKHLHREQKKIPVPALLWLTQELAAALEYIHTRRDANGAPLNLVHRDLNPPNILLSRVGEVKIADFGIARSADRPSLTQPGVMRGKLAYAAPEQAMDQPLDARTDLFALGITLYESATGQRLFGQQSETEMLRAVLENAAENPAAARPELPAVFCEAVHALLQREPSKRLQSGGALEEKLAAEFRAHASEGRQQLIKLISEVGKEAASVEPIPSLSTALTETVTRTALKQP